MTLRELLAATGDRRLTWNAVQPCLTAMGARTDWFNGALTYLKQSHDADGWHVLMYGA